MIIPAKEGKVLVVQVQAKDSVMEEKEIKVGKEVKEEWMFKLVKRTIINLVKMKFQTHTKVFHQLIMAQNIIRQNKLKAKANNSQDSSLHLKIC